MQVKSVAECFNNYKGSILQYFRPSLSYHLSLRSLFCLFLSGRFTRAFSLYLLLCEERYFQILSEIDVLLRYIRKNELKE